MSMPKIALQLYTIRDAASQDFAGALEQVAAFGYRGVEFAGYGGMNAIELKRLLDQLGLQAVGSHVDYERILEALDDEIAFNQTIGNRYIVVPYLTEQYRQNGEDWRQVFANLHQAGLKCAEHGIILCYHNHDFELQIQLDGERVLDAMYQHVPASALQVELDTCWVHAAGCNPIAYIEQYAGRLPLIHLKDMQRLEDGSQLTVEFGQGEVPLLAIAEAASKANVEWIIVEQDFCQRPSLECAANNIKWLKQNLASGA